MWLPFRGGEPSPEFRWLLALLGSLALPLSYDPSRVAAQLNVAGQNPSTIQLVTPGFNKTNCDANVAIELFYSGATPGNTLSFWRGSVDCGPAEARDGNTNNTECTRLLTLSVTVSQDTLREPLSTFVACTAGTVETVSITAVETSLGDGTGAALGATPKLDFKVDVDPPGVPTIDGDGAGDRTIPISWSKPSAGDLAGYRVYGLKGACGGDAGTNPLVGGAAPDATSLISGAALVTGTSFAVSPTGLSLALGETAGIAVTAIDTAGIDGAGNESTLSTPVCITRVETMGFCDALRNEGGTCTGCMAGSQGDPQPFWAMGPLVLALLTIQRRRRARSTP